LGEYCVVVLKGVLLNLACGTTLHILMNHPLLNNFASMRCCSLFSDYLLPYSAEVRTLLMVLAS
jgi:mRNA-degrading endonuclease YafQ of YafQ-DinJ toxin-antitoxin module